jgi:VWFA-related protein
VRRLPLLACGIAVLVGSVSDAQQGSAPVRPADQPVFRLSVSLVQLDAVVTDKKGRHVTTLGLDDFEVYQDGRPQPVIAVSYVDTEDTWVDTSGLPPLPVAALKPEDARRVIAVVVDDLRMSFESIYYARRGIGQFFDRHFQPGDLGMLVTTSGAGVSQLTYSPKVLKAASSRLRYSLWNVQAASALAPIDGVSGLDGAEGNYLERTFAESAILRIADAISAVKRLPGRKSVVLVSEGFSVYGVGWDNAYIRELLQRLVDRSNRAGVVIYAVDPRGLVVTGITAADNIGGGGAGVAAMRSAALRESQDGLRFVTGETGGFAVVNNNDLAMGFQRIMADQRGYYLIGYQPEAGTLSFKSDQQFRRVKIKVKPKGLKIRTRAGFYGQATE